MRVEWSEPALDDLADIIRYIGKDSALYAREFAEHIFAVTDGLADFPLKGRLVPEDADRRIREVIVRGYRVMYRVEPERVLMIAVMHGRRDVGGNPPWEIR